MERNWLQVEKPLTRIFLKFKHNYNIWIMAVGKKGKELKWEKLSMGKKSMGLGKGLDGGEKGKMSECEYKSSRFIKELLVSLGVVLWFWNLAACCNHLGALKYWCLSPRSRDSDLKWSLALKFLNSFQVILMSSQGWDPPVRVLSIYLFSVRVVIFSTWQPFRIIWRALKIYQCLYPALRDSDLNGNISEVPQLIVTGSQSWEHLTERYNLIDNLLTIFFN